jgi:AraC family transcriptional regulator
MSTYSPHIKLRHPLNLATTDWVTSRKSICLDGLIVEKGTQTPHEVEATFTHHVLGILISDGNSQEVTRIGDREYSGTFPRGTGFLTPAHAHHFSAWGSTDTGLNFIFDPVFLTQLAEQNFGLSQRRVELQCIPFIQDAQVTAITNLFHQEINTGGMGCQLYAESLRNILSLHVLRHYCTFSPTFLQPSSGLSSVQLNEVIDYIETYLSQPINLRLLAQVAKVSESHFSRLFKQSMGVAPHQYVLRRRVEEAKQLLKKSQMSTLEVALACGFAHQGHLSRHFKRIVGTTPKKFGCSS